MRHPGFPFIGAGDASYFEWAEMFVCFERVPTTAEAAKIGEHVPPPLRDTITWTGPVVGLASEQGVGRVIKAAYGPTPAKPTRLTTQSRFAQASTSADARFNADIDAWLVAADTVVPILVAFRREDHEAGGTRLSDWHRASVPALPGVIAKLVPEAAQLGELLVRAASAAKLPIDADAAARFAALVEAAETAEAEERAKKWDAMNAKSEATVGPPQPRYTALRTDVDLAVLAKVMPRTAKRLKRLATAGLAVRPAATAAAIAASEQALGTKLSREHRALLAAFDGGQLFDITVLGTAKRGVRGDAALVTFNAAYGGDDPHYVVVAHTGRFDVIAVPRGKASPVFLLGGTTSWGGGSTTRQCKSLDLALDLAIKRTKIWNNRGGG